MSYRPIFSTRNTINSPLFTLTNNPTANSILVFDDFTGIYVKSSSVTIDTSNNIATTGTISSNALTIDGTTNTVKTTGSDITIESGSSSNVILKSQGTSYTWPAADGSSGQILKTNGNGTLSFATLTADANLDAYTIKIVAEFVISPFNVVVPPIFDCVEFKVIELS